MRYKFFSDFRALQAKKGEEDCVYLKASVFHYLVGKWTVTRILTVFLSAFSFVMLALASMGYLFDRADYIARAYYNLAQRDGYVVFCEDGSFGEEMDGEKIAALQEKAGISFVFEADAGVSGWSHFIHGGTPPALQLFGGVVGSFGLAGAAEEYEAVGFTLLAGKYPDAANEVAISEIHYEALREGGYVDASKQFVWEEFMGEGYFVFDENLPQGESASIASYEDILGKTIGNGDVATDSHASSYTIVGVVQTNISEEELEEMNLSEIRTNPAAHLLFAEERAVEEPVILFGGVENRKTMRRCVRLILDWRQEQGGTERLPAPRDYKMLLPDDTQTDEWLIGVICGGLGGVLLLFSVLLCWHLATATLRLKEKKIGIFRSMGASEKLVVRLLTAETLFTCSAIFLAALLGTVLVYFLWLFPATELGGFGVSFLVFNGWTVFILAALSFVLPLCCTALPLKKFLKKPIVSNIAGDVSKKEA